MIFPTLWWALILVKRWVSILTTRCWDYWSWPPHHQPPVASSSGEMREANNDTPSLSNNEQTRASPLAEIVIQFIISRRPLQTCSQMQPCRASGLIRMRSLQDIHCQYCRSGGQRTDQIWTKECHVQLNERPIRITGLHWCWNPEKNVKMKVWNRVIW